jgi:hypothetical protein
MRAFVPPSLHVRARRPGHEKDDDDGYDDGGVHDSAADKQRVLRTDRGELEDSEKGKVADKQPRERSGAEGAATSAQGKSAEGPPSKATAKKKKKTTTKKPKKLAKKGTENSSSNNVMVAHKDSSVGSEASTDLQDPRISEDLRVKDGKYASSFLLVTTAVPIAALPRR